MRLEFQVVNRCPRYWTFVAQYWKRWQIITVKSSWIFVFLAWAGLHNFLFVVFFLVSRLRHRLSTAASKITWTKTTLRQIWVLVVSQKLFTPNYLSIYGETVAPPRFAYNSSMISLYSVMWKWPVVLTTTLLKHAWSTIRCSTKLVFDV